MKDIKQIIANNLINLRKKHNLTQNDLAAKLNYSDNAISRWEHAEVTPSIETLEQIAIIYNVPLRALIEDNAVKQSDISDKQKLINSLAKILIAASAVWLIATVIFVATQFLMGKPIWQVYVWSLPIISLVMLPFHKYWGRHIYKFTVITIFLWTLLASIFVTLFHLTPWMWLIFTLGAPIEVGLAIWAFVKPKPKAPISEEKIRKKEKHKERKVLRKQEKRARKLEKKQIKSNKTSTDSNDTKNKKD